ncbi:ROK family protein [Blautia sp. MSJ-19]|uniref:ROK family protein n=1 Tax=Blautia sp. MSJ-19 TaxID=2841517 RepID=UPI001C0F3AF3|nr:ROK family protein [Blautia sp. MSJ-19]MBU5481635.1 ROK family protein [Blautia sp. MSJ-19]
MSKSGVNNTLLKQRNRGLILKLIATGQCSSRIELSQKTGLAKMTVTYIVNEFLESGIFEERQKVQVEGKGRNPVQLCISEKAPKLIGVHLYREKCSVVLCDMQLKLLKKISFPVNKETASQLMENICKALDQIVETLDAEKVYGIGIGAIGPVDKNQGKILAPPNFYGLHDLEITREIEERYHMPVFFDGESNCAAIMEKYYGAGTDCEDFIYVDLANGVGSGLVVNGELYSNTSGMICELGHTSIDWKGELCGCGNRGCLERYISSNILEKQLQEATGDRKSFREFCQEMDEAIWASEEKAEAFTERAQNMNRIFTEMAEKLSCALTGFVNSLNPQKIIIGHEGYWIPDKYLHQVEQMVNERHIERKYRQIQVVKSGFKDEATVYGCTGALLTAVFDGRLLG